MTESEVKTAMERHNITSTQRAVYHYQGCNYGRLEDALNYAELVTARGGEPDQSSRSERAEPGR